MVSLIAKSLQAVSLHDPSPSRRTSLASLSQLASSRSDSPNDDDDVTVTTKRSFRSPSSSQRHSNEDLRLLAISAQITEISYNISDIQTRIFEIQELRHQAVNIPESSSAPSNASTSAIDQALINLDERLEAVSHAIDDLDSAVQSMSPSSRTPTQNFPSDDEASVVLRKRQAMMEEWDAVQKESEELRKELSDDKWLVVFRTVTEQADNMMASLEKILTQCQDFMWQVQRRNVIEPFSDKLGSLSDPPQVDFEHYLSLANNLEAKKTYYMPSITKILSILDKGIREHTKNGECLRRHGESRARWRNLRERIGRVDMQMEGIRRTLSGASNDPTPSESDSTASHVTTSSKGTHLTTSVPSSKSRSPSSLTLSRSISPFRKFAARVTNTITPGRSHPATSRAPSSDPVPNVRSRSSLFFLKNLPTTPPDHVRHMHSFSLVSPISSIQSPSRSSVDTPTKPKNRWNSSTKVNDPPEQITIFKVKPARRPSNGGSVFCTSIDAPPVPPLPPRSASRSSVGSSRPWSPVASTSTMSTMSSHASRPPLTRSLSRQTDYGIPLTPRSRPKTPSHIPTPTVKLQFISAQTQREGAEELETSLMERAFSPTMSVSGRSAIATERSRTPSRIPTPRAPSRSQVSVPTVSISRPSSSLSRRTGNQTPESVIRARALQVPIYRGGQTPRPSLSRGPPSSYRGDTRTPILDRKYTASVDSEPAAQYIPNLKDPLDVEVAKTVNGIAHGFLIQRVDPPLRSAPPGQELKAQYAVSNALGRKILNCRLVVIKRYSTNAKGDNTTRKVMCRVGGGWLDLHMYLLNHQAGI